jgi:ATP-dependent DNA helicase RecQ
MSSVDVRDEADQLLVRLTGRGAAAFRPGQWQAIERLVEGRARVLVVQRTGWGKSAVYFIATRLLRDRGAGPTLLISPLLALMRNQLQMAQRAGVRAATIHSENRTEWEEVEGRVQLGTVDLLVVSPERLNNTRFRTDVLPQLNRAVGLLVVDEAHCISDWGNDFRPDYRRIRRLVDLLPAGVPVLCTTATANDRVVADIVAQLGDDLVVERGSLDRESLSLAVVELPKPARRLTWLATRVPEIPGSGIVYCLTVSDAERVAAWLRTRGINARSYSSEADSADRVEIEQQLLSNDVKVVVATSGLGMGFDKPDLTFVVHYQSPGSPIAYYQQVGRAGRPLDVSQGILLAGREDAEIQDWFIRTAFPPPDQAERVVGLLEESALPMSMRTIETKVNMRHSRLELMLKVLEVDGAVQRADGGWRRTLRPWSYDDDRVQRVTAARRSEQVAMREYAAGRECRMMFLRRQLDDQNASECGRCDRCGGWSLDVPLEASLVAEAAASIRRQSIDLKPRKLWPGGPGLPSGRIAEAERLRLGKSLSAYNDGGWGSVVKVAKYGGGSFSNDLVDATVELLAHWKPDPAPGWVTFVPSASQPELVCDFARRLADCLGLPALDVVRRVRQGRPQKEMDNSTQQLTNVYGAFEVIGPIPPQPVLLMDDIVDSGWTLTIVGVALARAGSGPVHPLVLNQAVSSCVDVPTPNSRPCCWHSDWLTQVQHPSTLVSSGRWSRR